MSASIASQTHRERTNDVRIAVGTEMKDKEIDRLRSAAPEVTLLPLATAADPLDAVRGADAYLGRIDPEIFRQAGQHLRWVHSIGAGIETISGIPELVESNITVTNTRGAHAPFIAEHTFALLLGLQRHIAQFVQDQRDHVWKRSGFADSMQELYGRTMVIIGMGNIGTAIAKRALAFEMTVIGVDREPDGGEPGGATVRPIKDLDETLGIADVLVVAAPYTAETYQLLDARRIGLLPERAVVIVVSRGGIVDEEALADRLRNGTLAGAGLDVFATEPIPPDSRLWDTPRLIVTPHCSGGSNQTRNRVMDITIENVRRFVARELLLNVCDKRAGY